MQNFLKNLKVNKNIKISIQAKKVKSKPPMSMILLNIYKLNHNPANLIMKINPRTKKLIIDGSNSDMLYLILTRLLVSSSACCLCSFARERCR